MNYKKSGNTYWLRIDRNEEIIATLKLFAKKENIINAAVNGIGAVDHVIAGLYDTANKKYISNIYTGDMEIVSLTGSITQMNNEPYLHLHIGISDISGNMRGGHLNEARVSGTCEININLQDGTVDRKYDKEIGLNLMDFN